MTSSSAFSKGYPPHDTGVNEGEAEISHQGNSPIETLKKEDKVKQGKLTFDSCDFLNLLQCLCPFLGKNNKKNISSYLPYPICITRLPPRDRNPA